MTRLDKLQFQRLPAEAQRAALWRLAWSGLTPEQVAERIGWTTADVRRAMDEETAQTPIPMHALSAAAVAAAGAMAQ
jgi:hypothetical protein